MRGPKEVTIPCRISAGMFSSERQVVVRLSDGREFAALVDRRDVIPADTGVSGIEGRLRVSLVQKEDGTALVDFPQAGFAHGTRVRVSAELIADDPKRPRNQQSNR